MCSLTDQYTSKNNQLLIISEIKYRLNSPREYLIQFLGSVNLLIAPFNVDVLGHVTLLTIFIPTNEQYYRYANMVDYIMDSNVYILCHHFVRSQNIGTSCYRGLVM